VVSASGNRFTKYRYHYTNIMFQRCPLSTQKYNICFGGSYCSCPQVEDKDTGSVVLNSILINHNTSQVYVSKIYVLFYILYHVGGTC
jgi:hypothetical protein